MKVFITGVNGFLGSYLARRLVAAGYLVEGSVRDPSISVGSAVTSANLHAWSLNQNFAPDILAGQDLLIHCAYAPGRRNEELNIRGTRAAMRAGENAEVPQQIFLSSFSARPDAASGYGRMKYSLEQDFLAGDHGILRPGLVLGPGGLFAGMVKSVRRLPVIPVPDGGRRGVPIIGRSELVDCILQVIEAGQDRPLNLCFVEQPSLRDLLRSIARGLAKRRLLLPFPSGLALLSVQLMNSLGLRFGVDAESLRAYRTNTADLHLSDYPSFDLSEPDLDVVVKQSLAESPA